MTLFYTLLFLFIFGCVCGWILEFFFRRIVHKKWINPGFLAGPCLPLYGTGLVLLYTLCLIDCTFISVAAWRHVFMIVLITAVMTLLEYVTGLIFIKGFKVMLWDYSDRWGNIGGIVCPLFTLFWGAIGAGYYFLLHEGVVSLASRFAGNPYLLFPLGIVYGVFLIDLCYSFHVVTRLRKWAAESEVVVKYEELKESIVEKAQRFKEKANFLFPFKSKNGLENEFRHYLSELKSKLLRKDRPVPDDSAHDGDAQNETEQNEEEK